MKKRLISILLTVLMVMSMFTGMSVSAYADDVIDSSYYKEYTLVEGDYVLRICQRMGINYYTCKEAIMALNNITSENGFRYLSIGETVKIPVSDAAAVAIMTGKPIGSTGSGSTGSGTADVPTGDSVKYYLIPYTMQRGETVLGVCNSLGINFTNNADLIQAVNGIKSWNAVKAGDTILLPSTKTPAVGTTCYAVTAHKIASGETTYTICQNKGINYGSNTKLLQALNPKTNFSSIKAGATMYLPIATTIKAASTNTNTGSTNTGNTTDKNNTTTDKNNTTSTTAKAYDINANINTTYGSMKFYVGNKEVNTAAEGAVVTVDVITNDNKAVESLVVKYDDGRADLNLESNSFIMPNCDVRVDANIKSGYDITINSNYSMKTVAQVSGINVSSASAGNSVKIVSTDPSYAVKEVEAYYSTLFGLKKNILTVNSQFAFSMPDKDVTVDVTMAPVETYNFFRGDTENGSFDIQVDGSSVSKAAKGAKVTVVWQPVAGYEIEAINVFKAEKDGKPIESAKINVYNNSFTMPAAPVYVQVLFAKSANVIDIEAVEGGILIAKVKGEVASEALTGDTVTVTADGRESGYEADQIKELVVTRKADGHRVEVSMSASGDSASFLMPAGGVTISGKLVSVETNTVSVKFNAAGSENRVTIKADGVENWTVNDTMTGDALKHEYAVGTELRLSTLARDTHAFNKFEVYVADVFDAEMTEKANSQGVITMPNKHIRIEATFKAGMIEIGQATVVGKGTVSYKVNGVTALSAKVGDTVTIVPVSADPNLSVAAKDITVLVNNKTKTELKLTADGNGGFCFQMPKDGVSITVTFASTPHVLTLKTVDNTYGKDPNALQGKSLWGVFNTKSTTTNDVLYENNASPAGTVIESYSGEAIIVTLTKALTDKYNVEKVVMTGTKTGDVHEGGVEYSQDAYRFFMANEDLTITVYLKEKTSKSCSLLDLKYDSSKLTVGCTVGAFDSDVVTSCMVGDVVYVIPKVINTAEYELKADGITITKKSSDNVGNGSFTQGAANVPNADMVANTYYPAVDSANKVVGWKYIMPEGGVNVSVAVSAVPYNITLIVKDTNGNETVDGAKLAESGYVVINTTENNVTTARQVANGMVEGVKFGQAVNVSLSEAGAKFYTLKSVAVEGVTVKNNGFWMPANPVDLQIVLEAKEVAPTKVNIKTASLSNGTIQYYADSACTQLIVDNKAEVGKYIYAMVTPGTGYQLSSFSAINSNDKTVIADMTKGNEGNGKFSILVPEHDINVSAAFEIKSYTLTINLETDAHVEQVKVQVGKGTVNTLTSKTQTITVPYNSTVKLTVADTKAYTLVDAPVTPADASVAAVSVSKNASSANFKMPASDATVAVDLNSK